MNQQSVVAVAPMAVQDIRIHASTGVMPSAEGVEARAAREAREASYPPPIDPRQVDGFTRQGRKVLGLDLLSVAAEDLCLAPDTIEHRKALAWVMQADGDRHCFSFRFACACLDMNDNALRAVRSALVARPKELASCFRGLEREQNFEHLCYVLAGRFEHHDYAGRPGGQSRREPETPFVAAFAGVHVSKSVRPAMASAFDDDDDEYVERPKG